jgi:4-amino-4-deoxy-L-arabinose transferase-like glycosyltransferase
MDTLRKLEPWIIFFGSLALFLYGIFGRELIGFETHGAVFAQEMLKNGFSFFPTTYGIPYPATVSGLALINSLFALVFGKFSTFSAIFAGALASSLTLVLIYKIALPFNREWGRIAVLLSLFTYEFFDATRSLTPEPFILLACTWALYLLIRQYAKTWLTLPLLFGFFIDGPAGFILPALTCISFYIAHRNWLMLKQFSSQASLFFLGLCLLLLAAAKWQGDTLFVKEIFKAQILNPLLYAKDFSLLTVLQDAFTSFAIAFELALIGIILWFYERKSLNTIPHPLMNTFAILIPLTLLCIYLTGPHKIRYALPMMPALALLGASLWLMNTQAAKMIRQIFSMICLALPFILILLCIATIVVIHLKSLEVNAHYISAFCTLTLFALASAYILFHHPMEYANRNPKKIIGIGLASFLAAIIFVVKPIEISLNRVRPFVNHVVQILPANSTITFYKVRLNAEPVQFLSSLRQPVAIYFTDTLNDSRTIYITEAETFDDMPNEQKQKLKIILREKLGHKEMAVFQLEN